MGRTLETATQLILAEEHSLLREEVDRLTQTVEHLRGRVP